jgi:hypothetical protein
MNRKFFAPATPARARLLGMLAAINKMTLDDSVLELADRDRVSVREMELRGITDPVDQQAIQFIHDMGFRCGIPTKATPADVDRGNKIVRVALEIAEIKSIMVISSHLAKIPMKTLPMRNEIESMLPHRNELLVVDMSDEGDMELAGKLFPRVIAVGRLRTQLAFSFGAEQCTTTKMAKMLYPGVEHSLQLQAAWMKRNTDVALIAMGLFPYLLERPAEVSPFILNLGKKIREKTNIDFDDAAFV